MVHDLGIQVGLVLTIITAFEVWAYYIPSLVASPLFVPLLLIMSAVKFIIVVLFYMHLRYDHKLFKALFTGPLLVAANDGLWSGTEGLLSFVDAKRATLASSCAESPFA